MQRVRRRSTVICRAVVGVCVVWARWAEAHVLLCTSEVRIQDGGLTGMLEMCVTHGAHTPAATGSCRVEINSCSLDTDGSEQDTVKCKT